MIFKFDHSVVGKFNIGLWFFSNYWIIGIEIDEFAGAASRKSSIHELFGWVFLIIIDELKISYTLNTQNQKIHRR